MTSTVFTPSPVLPVDSSSDGQGFWKPLENPYPHQGSGVTLGICHGFFIYTNLFLLLLLLYNLYMVNVTALPVDEMLIYRLMQYLLLHRMIIQ